MIPAKFSVRVLLIAAALALSACGLATSDEERMQRATEQMESGAYRAAIIELKNVLASDSRNVRARLLLAEVSLGIGDLETAEKELSRAAEFGAADAEVRNLNLRILAAKGAHSEVLAALGMETSGLTEAEQLQYRGEALLGLGNAAEAKSTFDEWLALDPASADAAVGSALADASLGNIDAAVEKLEATVAAIPDSVSALYALATLQTALGDYAAAETSLQTALGHIDPKKDLQQQVRILSALSSAQLALSKNEAARKSLARLSGIVPDAPGTLFLSARLARADQDYALAARQLQMLLNVSPDNAAAQLLLANVQMMQGNFAQAEVLLNRVVALSPGNIMARKLLAEAQVRQAQPQSAMEALAPLIESAEEDADVYNLLAQIGMQQGDARSVVKNLRAAATASPDDVTIKMNLAAAYLDIGETDLAADALAGVPEDAAEGVRRQQLQLAIYRALQQNSDANRYVATLLQRHAGDPDITQVVSKHFVEAGDLDLGRQILVDFLNQYGDDTGVLLALARLELSADNTAAAAANFEKVQQLDADNLFAMLGMARIAEIEDDVDGAIAILTTAAEQNETALSPRIWLATLHMRENRLAEAEAMANELLAIGYQNAAVSEIVGGVLMAAGRLNEAVVQFELAERFDPNSLSILLNAARAYAAVDRTVDAKRALNRALEVSPGWIPAKTMLALVELRQGQAAAAERHVAELRADHPDDLSVMVLEGEVHLYQRNFEAAATAFNRAVANGAGTRAVLREYQARLAGNMATPDVALTGWLAGNPDDLIVRTTLAQHYLQSGAGNEAVTEFETILEAQPDNAAILNNLAWQYQQLGMLDKALAAASKAYEIQSESGAIADTLAWIHRDLGDLEKSRKLLSDAVRLAPENGEITYHLAAVMAELGDESEARQILEKLIASDARFPSRGEAEELLSEL